MTTEQKAKAYDEAKACMSRAFNSNRCTISFMNEIFPELKESEDERIRKVLIDYFNIYKRQEECGIKTFFGIPTDNILAWLEKQDEYDDNIITRDDEILQAISVGLTDMVEDFGWSDFGGLPIEEIQEWIERKGEHAIACSEEDSVRLQRIIDFLWYNRKGDTDAIYQQEQDIDWLKSLKQRIGG